MRHLLIVLAVFLSTGLCLLPARPVQAGPKGPTSSEEIGVLAEGELAAVQKPLFPTRQTVEVGLFGTVLPNDPYVFSGGLGLAFAYHLSEQLAADLLIGFAKGRDTAESLKLQQLGVQVDAYEPRLIVSANGQWTPIYAKLNLLGLRVVHFDIAATGGVGLFLAERVIFRGVEGGDPTDRFNRPLAANVGLAQRFYTRIGGRTMALRFDLRDYVYLQRGVSEEIWLKHNWLFGLGISVFFDSKQHAGSDS